MTASLVWCAEHNLGCGPNRPSPSTASDIYCVSWAAVGWASCTRPDRFRLIGPWPSRSCRLLPCWTPSRSLVSRTRPKPRRQIQHPNIVPVYAIGAERGVHYYAMQLIDDQPLDRAITQLRGDSDDAVSNSTTPAADVNTVRAPSSGAVGPPPVRS